MRALITRPAEDAQEIADALRARGFEVVIEPMLEIVPLDAPAPDLFDVQALLFTSANGVRAFTRLATRRDLPVFAVGDATAAAARAAGFTGVHSAGGGTGDLARLVRARLRPDAGALLHVSGSAVAGDLADALAKDGFHVRREMLYEARPAAALSPALLLQLKSRGIDVVLFFSPRTARTFVSLVRGAGLDASLDRAIAICLSHAVAAALAGMPLRALRVAARPELAALLAEIGSPGGDVSEPRKEQPAPSTSRRRGRAAWLAVLVLALALVYATAPHWRGALPAEWQARLDPYLPAGASGGAGALEAEIAQLKAAGAAREGALGALIFALNRRVDGLEQTVKAQGAQPPAAAQTGQPAGPDPALSQRLESMEHTLAELQNRRAPAQPATPDPALGQRLESVERAVAALKTAPAAAGAAPQSSDRALESRIIGLEARPAAPDLRPLIDRIAALEARPAGPDSAASSPDFVRL
ncbi:MAG TPA: uroporphyrinogen-III synthase, partial [Alphaproteobacteria bacterium]